MIKKRINGHFGTEGERVEITGRALTEYYRPGKWGTMCLGEIQTKTGEVYHTKTTKPALRPPFSGRVVGTIHHETYQGKKKTYLKRVKLLEQFKLP